MSGQLEISIREIKVILEKMIARSMKDLADNVDDVLWAYCMTFKSYWHYAM